VKPGNFPSWLRDTLLRMFPHAARTGLRRVGHPQRDSPVLVTGNFTLTVRRMLDALAGRDVWLLVANSHGINVWCAAGGGHLTHHDVIAVLRSSMLEKQVDHRVLILPQLAATGVERARVHDVTGWEVRWGPARLEDLPAFLDRGARVTKTQRYMRFPLWERLEMAAMWGVPLAVGAAAVVFFLTSLPVALVVLVVVLSAVLALFALVPHVRVTGPWRFATHFAFAAAGSLLGAGVLQLIGRATPGALIAVGVSCLAGMALLSLDLAGTTPWFASEINSIGNRFDIELIEDRCTGRAECVQVCPRNVLAMNGARRKVEVQRGDDCIRCGACIVQCPEDALRFRFADGRVVEAPTIRTTRLNMLGRRSVAVPGEDRSRS
jgi:NAD-dependent dihydropyrimidine dehydrogenase PreA subunit